MSRLLTYAGQWIVLFRRELLFPETVISKRKGTSDTSSVIYRSPSGGFVKLAGTLFNLMILLRSCSGRDFICSLQLNVLGTFRVCSLHLIVPGTFSYGSLYVTVLETCI